MDLSELLAFAVKNGASDIHISAGFCITVEEATERSTVRLKLTPR
jgi:Tfp pilus assembly pilus retraction ATPase PilT